MRLDALGRQAVVPREEGAEMIGRAIVSTATAPENKMELGTSLTGNMFFSKERKDKGSNPIAITYLARGLVNESDMERRLNWARYLASCILIEFSPHADVDRDTRISLIKTVRDPSAAKVLAALDPE